MRLIVAVVGTPKRGPLATAISDYEERALRYWPLHVVEVKDEPVRGGGSDLARRKEGERLVEAVGNAHVIACEVGGRRMTSPEFAAWLQTLREAASDVAFMIGGAFGLSMTCRSGQRRGCRSRRGRCLTSLRAWCWPNNSIAPARSCAASPITVMPNAWCSGLVVES